MNESTILATKTFTGSASLAAVGIKLAELKLFEPVAQQVQIAQKTIKDRPSDKLYDAFISILAGAHDLSRSIHDFEPMWACNELSGAAAVLSNRWCRTR